MTKYVTLIGSRNVPSEIATLQAALGYKLASLGYWGRSGAAGGSDTNFLLGYANYAIINNRPLRFTNYIPWSRFKNDCVCTLKDSGNWREDFLNSFTEFNNVGARYIASTLHPAWGNCKEGAKKLHTRNVAQMLGEDINTPSERVIFAAPEGNGTVKGGTATAVTLARKLGIPTSNLLNEDFCDKMKSWVDV